MNQKISLKALMRSLSEAATFANGLLRRDYTDVVMEMKNNERGFPMTPPHPLCIASMKVSFTAHVNESERISYEQDDGELQLDFGRPDGNFSGELTFKPYDPEIEYTTQDEGGK